ncbi:MAG: serine/threonine protein kinase, partial [Myxococcales bacterium]|nr:serine/threonine protein kinase [Myxococcales bacterium]
MARPRVCQTGRHPGTVGAVRPRQQPPLGGDPTLDGDEPDGEGFAAPDSAAQSEIPSDELAGPSVITYDESSPPPPAERAATPSSGLTRSGLTRSGSSSRSGSREETSTRVLERGDAVGRYVVLERVGAGGMGVVYAAWDPDLDRKVALKLLHGGHDPAKRAGKNQRLLREAQAMARLSHPNVITVHDVGEFDGRVFVAMEFIEGQTLSTWQQGSSDRPRSVDELLGAWVRAGRGLGAAHRQGLIHRDFKPDNVMVGDDGRVRVMDFGL